MYKFKLIKKINPQDKSAPKKWYAVPISESPQSFRETARRATQNTTISAMELETAIDLLGSYAIEQLLAGHTIRIGNLGTLRITFKSEGVENIDDFSTSPGFSRTTSTMPRWPTTDGPRSSLVGAAVRQAKYDRLFQVR